MTWAARYPEAQFGGPVAENLLALVRTHQADALQWAAGAGNQPLPKFKVILNNAAGRLSAVFPVLWLDEEDSPLEENEDAALLQEEHRLTFWLAAKRVIPEKATPQAQGEATEVLRREVRTYVRAVTQIFLSANPVQDLTAGLTEGFQSLPELSVTRQRVVGPTGGSSEFIAYGLIEVAIKMEEGK